MLKNKSGKIVNITSIVGHTKYRSIKLRCFQSRYYCNVKKFSHRICKKKYIYKLRIPGFIKTNMTDKISEEYKNYSFLRYR